MAQTDPRDEIASRYDQLKSRSFPRGGPDSDEFADIAVTLAQYDGYVAGLVERYLRKMPLQTQAIAFPTNLEHAFEDDYLDDRLAHDFRTRWEGLRKLVELLSQATRVPLHRVAV